jgi:biotin operon repressor
MTLKYCGGSARLSETVFGWNRKSVQLGLVEKETGITCPQAKLGRSGRKRWEEKNAPVAQSLRNLAEANVQQEPTFNSTLGYTRLTASKAIAQLKQEGYQEAQLPKPTTINQVLNRMGYRLRKVVKAKPQKNCQKPIKFLKISKTKTQTHLKQE